MLYDYRNAEIVLLKEGRIIDILLFDMNAGKKCEKCQFCLWVTYWRQNDADATQIHDPIYPNKCVKYWGIEIEIDALLCADPSDLCSCSDHSAGYKSLGSNCSLNPPKFWVGYNLQLKIIMTSFTLNPQLLPKSGCISTFSLATVNN